MKAIICNNFGSIDDLVLEEIDDPQPQTGEILIKAQAMGVNFPDALLVQGLYQAKPQTPFTPGMEIVGQVVALGDGVEAFKIGDRVAAVTKYGSWAELVKCDQNAAMKIGDDISANEGVALLCGYGTAHHGLKQRANLQAGELLVVNGASGLTGLAAIQIGKAMGARVIAVASSSEKRDLAIESGADIALGYEGLAEQLKEHSQGKGVDVAFDVVGGEVFDTLSRSMAWGGRLLVIGFASGTIPKFAVNLALVKGYSVVGVFWGRFVAMQPREFGLNMEELMQWYKQGRVAPHIGGSYPLKDANLALRHIIERRALGKITLQP